MGPSLEGRSGTGSGMSRIGVSLVLSVLRGGLQRDGWVGGSSRARPREHQHDEQGEARACGDAPGGHHDHLPPDRGGGML
jgi:hypothetical protein